MRRKLPWLFSYAFIRSDKSITPLIRATSHAVDWMIDSGAFTDYTMAKRSVLTGRPYDRITMDEYIRWLSDNREHLWQYVQLDEVGQPEVTRRNLTIMTTNGLRPMPVLVFAEDPARMADLVDVNEYICVAGCGLSKRAWATQRIYRSFHASGGRAKIHGLGYVVYPDILKIPMATADHSSWSAGRRYGQVSFFEPHRGIFSAKKRQLSEDMWNRLDRAHAPRNIKYWTGHLSVPGLITGATYFQFQQYVETMSNRRVFWAVTHKAELLLAVSTVAAMGAGTGGRLNYPALREWGARLKRASKAGMDTLCAEIVTALQRYHESEEPAEAVLDA